MTGIINKIPARSKIVNSLVSVIQVVERECSGQSQNVNSTTLAKAQTGGSDAFYVTIDNVGASNYVYVTMTFVTFSATTANAVGSSAGMFRGSTKICEFIQYANYSRQDGVSGQRELGSLQTIQYMDKSPGTGTNTYHLGLRSDGTASAVLVPPGLSVFTAMEIQV